MHSCPIYILPFNKGEAIIKPTTKPASTGKPSGVCYDTGGHSYLLDSKTCEAIYVASFSVEPMPPSTNLELHEFISLVYDIITPAFIHKISDTNNDKYIALCSASIIVCADIIPLV